LCDLLQVPQSQPDLGVCALFSSRQSNFSFRLNAIARRQAGYDTKKISLRWHLLYRRSILLCSAAILLADFALRQ